MHSVPLQEHSVVTGKDKFRAAFFWLLVLFSASVLFMGFAEASGAGGGTALQEFNDWLEGELGGSVGTALGLVAFLVSLIYAIAVRQFMPIIWGMGIGILLGIFLEVVVTATGAGLPIVDAVTSVATIS